MAYFPDHSLAPASAAPSGVPSGLPDSPSAVLAGPPWPNPLASIAYASCRPADMDPPAENSALTSRAAYERLNRAAARAETLVLYRLDMLAGCRDSLDVDQTRLEQSIQNLWRLTAVRKTLMSIESALSAPTPAPQGSTSGLDLQSALDEVRRLLAEVPTESAAGPSAPADQPVPASAEPPLPVTLSPSPSPSCSQSQSTSSMGSMGSIPSIESIPPVAPSPVPPSAPSSHSSPVAPSPARPLAPSSSLAIGSVPACPRLSLSSAARTLDRVNADMANYTEYVTTAADYNSNITAEEFLCPSLSPKSAPVPAHAHTPTYIPAPSADNSPISTDTTTAANDSPLLADPALSPSLKSQISTRTSSPSSDIPHSAFHIPHLDRPPD